MHPKLIESHFQPRVSDTVGQEWSLIMCTVTKFPSKAEAVGVGTLWDWFPGDRIQESAGSSYMRPGLNVTKEPCTP